MTETVKRIESCKIIAQISGVAKSRIIPLVGALLNGGIDCIDISFDPNGEISDRDVSDEILMVSEHLGNKICIGAGGVTDIEKTETAKRCGADFILSPVTDSAVIKRAKELSLTVASGAFTPTEILTASLAGADIVNVFPASFFGTEYLDVMTKELPQLKLLASGGINVWNMRAFLDSGCIAAVIDNGLINEVFKAECDYEIIAQTAAAFKGIAENKRRV